MSKIVGYNLSGQDNNSYMFSGVEESGRCLSCRYRLDLLKYNPNYAPKNSMQDFSITYDGFWIVSVRFRNFCLQQNYEDLEFERFQLSSDYFNLKVNRIVAFDYERRQTRFEKRCNVCGNFESTVGAVPTYLLVNSPLERGIYRTDILFASGNEKHPLIVVGLNTKTEMDKYKLTGIEFSDAFGIV